eukprot:1014455_1
MGKRNMLQIHGNDGYQLDCKTEWGPYVYDGKSYASCEQGYAIWGCSGYSVFYRDSLAGYYRASNSACIAQSVSTDSLRAIATCCRLYKEPTPLPTKSPTPGPTPSPTPGPTSSLSTDPTTVNI